MPNPPKSTQRSRLQAAGWVYVEGWLPGEDYAYDGFSVDDVRELLDEWAECAERIANTPQERGRPKKEPKP